jgi:penicillin-binding protein 2
MFERRLRWLLVFTLLVAAVLVMRALQLQVGQREKWEAMARADAERRSFFPARRGDLLDVKGRVIATDAATFDAVVDFRVMGFEPESRWWSQRARTLASRLPEWSEADRAKRAELIEQQKSLVIAELDLMWDRLAEVTGMAREQIDGVRRSIVSKVQRRREAVLDQRYRRALEEYEAAPRRPWYSRWIVGERQPPDRDELARETIADERGGHVVVPGLTTEQYNQLSLELESLPGLSLRKGLSRYYPYGSVAAQTLGYLSPVTREDLDEDPFEADERKRYGVNDQIGRDGLERLFESRLRGSRGVLYYRRPAQIHDAERDTPGENIRTSIDIEFQRDIEEAFKRVDFYHPDRTVEPMSMNGAAVVLDVASGQVRALVSVPTFDLNRFSAIYPELLRDDINRPLHHRALTDSAEPGSTIKTVVGIGAISQGLVNADTRIECTGYPVFDGRRFERPRCWTMSMFNLTHREVPPTAPHETGALDFADAIERSCNIYFETVGDRMRLQGLAYWMGVMGLGRETGIGLGESPGRLPRHIDGRDPRSEAWFASIGQGPILVTPIQMAQVAALIARDGTWVRPNLLAEGTMEVRSRTGELIADRVELKLSKEALRAAREGMKRVVNSPAGTGDHMRRQDVQVAAKTGSATANPLTRFERDAEGNLVYDNEGKPIATVISYGTRTQPNPIAPWYRESDVDATTGRSRGTHAWAIGFAPAENPTIAFAVYVEYGNKGNYAAGSVVQAMLESAVKRGMVGGGGE